MREEQPLYRSLRDALEELLRDISSLLQSEYSLARTELKSEVKKLGAAVVLLAIGATLGLFATGFFMLAIVYELSVFVAPWLAALIVAVGTALVAGLVVWGAWNRLSKVDLKPRQTLQSMKENVTWLKGRLK